MAEGRMKCVTFFLFGFNLLFFLSGILVITGGALLLTKYREVIHSFLGTFSSYGFILISIGVIIFVISFFGCCGAFSKSYCLIVTYAALLALILLLEIGCVLAGIVMKDRLQTVIENHLMRDMKEYGHNDDVTITWDQRQIELHCCGATSYTNWNQSTYLNSSVPGSCCISEQCNVTGLAVAPEDYAKQIIFTSSCVENVKHRALDYAGIFFGVAAGLTIIQIVSIVLASCLAWNVKKKLAFV